MTPSVLMQLALFVAPPQMPPAVIETPSLAPALAIDAAGIQANAPPISTGSNAATPAADIPPELADPLADPASEPKLGTPPKTSRHYPGDPLEGFNRTMFRIQMGLDKSIYGPLAKGYQHLLPKPVRGGLRNFFRNLSEPVVFLNDLLQLKPGRAVRTLARFTINSTLGLGGLIDVAGAKGNLPHHNNGFGSTLAYYGVHGGPYLFLPLIGPTTLRDLAGGPVDGAVLPVAVGKPFTEWRYKITSTVITGLDLRAESDPELRALFSGAVDPYATLRSVWLQNRANEISELHSHRKMPPPAPEFEDPLRDPAAPSSPPGEPSASPLQEPIAPSVVAPAAN